MSKLEDQLVNMLRTAKEDTRNDISLEENKDMNIFVNTNIIDNISIPIIIYSIFITILIILYLT